MFMDGFSSGTDANPAVRRVLLRVVVVENAALVLSSLSIYHLPGHNRRTLAQVASRSSGAGEARVRGEINSTYRPDDDVINASLPRSK